MTRLGTLLALAVCLGTSVLYAADVGAWEGTIELPTYELGAPDPNPAFPLINRHNIYPYTMLDDLTDRRETKTYRALFLENEYLRATILPELGGRLYSLYDKIDHREVFYRNEVVKYGLVGLRGAWIAGGVEFNFPNGHTTLTVSPVTARLIRTSGGSATAVVGAVDWVTGMHWEVALSLRSGEARLEQHVTLVNSTALPNLYWYWANAAVAATPDMQFIYPMREANPHSFTEIRSYPIWRGVDYSWYKNIRQPTSLFGREVHRNFFGAYYHASDFGLMHVADFREVPGKKIWSWGVAGDGLIWTDLLTDRDGPYNEIQSGRYETQLTQEFMRPRRVESWTEYWYPVQGLGGGCLEATESLALNVTHPVDPASAGGVKLTFWPVVGIPGAKIIAKAGGKTIGEFGPVDLRPTVLAAFALPGNLDQQQPLAVEAEDHTGRTILRWSSSDPIDGNPDLVPAAGIHAIRETPASEASVEELFLRGVEDEKRGEEDAAAGMFQEVLERDPAYIPALIKLAWRSYRAGDLAAAEGFITRARARNSTDPQVEYAAGVISRAGERWSAAKDAFWASIRFGGALAPALAELGEISIRERNYDEAARYLRGALAHQPEDAIAQSDLAVALRLEGRTAEAGTAVDAALDAMPLLPYALAERWRVSESGGKPSALGPEPASDWNKPLPGDVQYYFDVAAWYLRLGDLPSANAVLSAARGQLPVEAQSPLLDYYLAYVARRLGQSDKADELVLQGSQQPDAGVFPNRLEDERVLADAHSHLPRDGRVCDLLGAFLFAHGRYGDGAKLWREAVDDGFDNSVIERNLGVYAWRIKRDLAGAADFYVKSIRLAPNQYRLYPDLDEIYSEMGDRSRRAQLFAAAPAAVLDRDVVRVRRALWLVEQRRFDEALSALANHRFKPWEGGEIVREMYVLAHIAKGRQALGSRRPADAEQQFRQALEYPPNLGVGKPDKPQDEQPLYWLGEALAAQGNTNAARLAWREAVETNSASETANAVYRAAALQQLGRVQEAQNALAQALAAAEQVDAAAPDLYAAGIAKRFAGDEAQARLDFEHALKADPAYWQARVELEQAPIAAHGASTN